MMLLPVKMPQNNDEVTQKYLKLGVTGALKPQGEGTVASEEMEVGASL